MGVARHPKPYKGGKRQVTVPWKRRVLAKLAEHKAATPRRAPWNIDQLMERVGAPKGSLNTLLKIDVENPQTASAYTDEISEVLGITPPVLEEDGDDPGFADDVLLLRTLSPESRRALMMTAQRLEKRRR
jgi:hypothetical protein